ncbi:hypothetical protein J1614_001986 [Plenodomus biglobosus]|nr:hypothetical protein J1614_001986 [Plenodomus biglobosus]
MCVAGNSPQLISAPSTQALWYLTSWTCSVFTTKTNESVAYGYWHGPVPDMSGVAQGFVKDFVEYIVSNALADLLGLQVFMDGIGCNIGELVPGQGTVMMDIPECKLLAHPDHGLEI